MPRHYSWSGLPEAGRRWIGAIENAAHSANIDPRLLAALVQAESNFNPNVVSSAGAIGLAQLMPGTARGLGVNPRDPVQNLQGGARYLRQQLDRFGNVDLALAAYNAGPNRQGLSEGRIPNIPETQAYVPRVLEFARALGFGGEPGAETPSLPTGAAAPDDHSAVQSLNPINMENLVRRVFETAAQLMGGDNVPTETPFAQSNFSPGFISPRNFQQLVGPLGEEGIRLLMQEPEAREVDSPLADVNSLSPSSGGGQGSGQAGHSHPTGPGLAWGGFQNGRIPLSAMTGIPDVHWRGKATHYMRPDAANAFQAMRAAARRDGVNILLTDSYRSYDAQVRVRREKGSTVATATPGTSRHGWGLAIDVANPDARRWIQQNGTRFGWIWPEWAQRQGTKQYEPWHFEYEGRG